MLEFGNVVFVIEILLAEAIFLYSADRRQHFALRLTGAVAAVLLAAAVFPL